MTILCRPHIMNVIFACVFFRWARAARPTGESRLSAFPLAQNSGCSGSTKAKHLPGEECHHLPDVCLNLFLLRLYAFVHVVVVMCACRISVVHIKV